jgi:DNA-binding beta-propeller fold protein YncE
MHLFVLDSTGFDILTATITPPPTPTGTPCLQNLTFISNDPMHLAQRIELGQGTLQPLNFFASADGTQLYVASASNASVLVYDFGTGGVTGIELQGNTVPVSADMSPDAATIVIAGSDGLLHELSTGLGGSDQVQLSFPNLPNYLNPFCTYSVPQAPCKLDLVAVRP